MSDYLTVKEFAAAANVTPQRIYKLLSKDNGSNNGLSNRLKPYIKIENNQKYLDIKALELFEKNEASQQVEQRVEQRVECSCDEQTAQVVIAALEKQLEVMQQQLTVKDEQLRTKDVQIAEKDKQLERLSSALESTTAALTAAQALHAGTIQERLTTEPHEPQFKQDVSTHSEELMPTSEQQPEKELTEDSTQQKLSFFQRLFKRSKKQR